jgi:hypothetical protein
VVGNGMIFIREELKVFSVTVPTIKFSPLSSPISSLTFNGYNVGLLNNRTLLVGEQVTNTSISKFV